MVKLIVHIGNGKTGSSSIQKTLLKAHARLSAQNVTYLGIMLEHARNVVRPAWQLVSGSKRFFHETPSETATAQLTDLLDQELQKLDSEGVTKAIWSNEWILTRPQAILPCLQELQRRGVPVEIQCYVRRHDKWAQSAYAQWGLKDKQYPGPIRDFASWSAIFGDRDFRFAPSLEVWEGTFGADLRVFNFDRAGDVVQHFLAANGVTDIPTINDNISPDPVVTAAQAVFNSRARAAVLPGEFDRLRALAEKSDENAAYLPMLDQLAPSAATLGDIVRDRSEDIARIDALLQRSGEPVLSFDPAPQPLGHPSSWDMDQLILKFIFGLAEEVAHLRKQVVNLQSKVAADPPKSGQ